MLSAMHNMQEQGPAARMTNFTTRSRVHNPAHNSAQKKSPMLSAAHNVQEQGPAARMANITTHSRVHNPAHNPAHKKVPCFRPRIMRKRKDQQHG